MHVSGQVERKRVILLYRVFEVPAVTDRIVRDRMGEREAVRAVDGHASVVRLVDGGVTHVGARATGLAKQVGVQRVAPHHIGLTDPH